LVETLADKETAGAQYDGMVKDNPERGGYLPVVTITTHGIDDDYLLNYDLFHSADFRSIVALNETLSGLIEPTGFFQRGERKLATTSFAEGLAWLMKEARRGLGVQRYKGLGEMNPDQLWETTMDPETRRMLRVTIDDAIAADQMFTTLMGEEVEPRRNFIQSNALQVSNLDV
jgi:DNA gyrase subunit B